MVYVVFYNIKLIACFLPQRLFMWFKNFSQIVFLACTIIFGLLNHNTCKTCEGKIVFYKPYGPFMNSTPLANHQLLSQETPPPPSVVISENASKHGHITKGHGKKCVVLFRDHDQERMSLSSLEEYNRYQFSTHVSTCWRSYVTAATLFR